mmetsp:Transcript_16990/g.50708  ORF Transcript_16990/g.50708 Transcript_16990/m.50708 type:complete len:257 (-) Transcript_16990:1009-1779(-)
MSTMSPVCPLMPKVLFSASACLARSLVSTLITFAPQFWARVRGMTSKATPTAAYGHCSTPDMAAARSFRPRDTAISAAPPPGTKRGSATTLRATPMASCRFRSTSFSTSLLAPRNTTLHALGSLQSTMKVKNSSPILRTSNSPARVPMSDSRISSGRCTMVAPVARAIRLLSDLRRRRMAEMPALVRKCMARSDSPFSVTTTSGLNRAMVEHTPSIHSSSSFSSAAQSSSLVSSTLVWFSPFLYSRGQSMSRMRGL